MNFRSASLIAAVAAAGLLLAGCGTEEAGTPAPQNGGVAGSHASGGATGSGSGSPAPSESAGPGESAAPGEAVDPAEFADNLEAGMSTVTSLTATLDAGSGGQTGAGTLSQTMDNGALVAADMTIGVAGQQMKVRIVDGTFYVGGPLAAQVAPDAAGKEWILIDESSSNQQIKVLAESLAPIISNAGTDSYVFMARAITELSQQGTEKIGNFDTTKYRTVIDVQKMAEVLPESMKPYGELLRASGMQEMETFYWLDAQNRMVQSRATVEAAGQQQTTTLTVGSFDEPLEISAPDPATVYTG